MTDNPFSWLGDMTGGNQGEARDAMAENEAMMEKVKQAAREEARLFYDVFAVGRGPELLELLREKTIEQDLMSASLTIGNAEREVPVNPSEWAYHRNGQNSVVRFIEARVRDAMRAEQEENPNV